MKKPDRKTVELIRSLNARGFSITAMADSTGLEPDEVERMVLDLKNVVDPATELCTLLDTYSSMINDIDLQIAKRRKEDDLTHTEWISLMDKKSKFQEAKLKIIEKISDGKMKGSFYQSSLSSNNTEPEILIKPDTLIRSEQYEDHIYKIIGLLTQMNYIRKTLKELKSSDQKTIRHVVGCSKEEFRIIMLFIHAGDIPMITSKRGLKQKRRLRKKWIK